MFACWEGMMIGHPQGVWIGIVANWFLLIPPSLGGEEREQLVATARDGNRAAIQSITSMQCRYQRVPWADFSLEQARKHWILYSPGRFWRSGETYRHLRANDGDGTTADGVIRNGRALSVVMGGPIRKPLLAIENHSSAEGVGGQMWQWLLFSHWGQPLVSFHPFHEILAQPHAIEKAERLAPPSNDIHIELTHKNGRLEFWFDPKVNYLIRKSAMIPAADTSIRWEYEVLEFAERAPAVFVPVVIESRCSVKGTLEGVIRTILSELKVNQPLDKNALRIPGIEGMECYDLNREVKFKVDADGNRIGPEIPHKVLPPITRGKAPGGELEPPPLPLERRSLREPSRPPTSLWMWILGGSVLVLAAALILAVLRRRRQSMSV